MHSMRIIVGVVLGFSVLCDTSPLMSNRRPPMQPMQPMQRESGVTSFMLPSNATSIRADISEGFSCENRAYGYYADVANDCQIFHVCLPVMFANQRKSRTYQWSFICPEETVFSQDSFTCMRAEDMAIRCDESENFYDLNSNFGGMMEGEDMGQFREVTTTVKAETTIFTTTTSQEDGPMTTEEELTTESDMKSDLKTEETQELATEATFEAEPPEKVMMESESVIKTIEGIVEKAARDLERVNSTSPVVTRTKRKGQRRRFLFAADA